MNLFLSINEFSSSQQARVQKLLSDSPVRLRKNYDDDAPLEPEFRHCEIVFGNVPANWLKQSDALKWAQLDSVGFGEYRELDWAQLSSQISVTNLAGFFADPVAQTALAGILALYRGIDELLSCQSQKNWVGDPVRTRLRLLTGAKVVLFGYGSVNQRLATLLSAFDCTLTSFGRNWEPKALNAALESADVVVSTVPETDTTIGTFDRQRLAGMKNDALFVNCGRGSVVDEDALADALIQGTLGGAVIDVTVDEPLPSDHRLWSAPNSILTQHSGGGTADELDRKIDLFEDNLARYKQGQPLLNVVDFNRGY